MPLLPVNELDASPLFNKLNLSLIIYELDELQAQFEAQPLDTPHLPDGTHDKAPLLTYAASRWSHGCFLWGSDINTLLDCFVEQHNLNSANNAKFYFISSQHKSIICEHQAAMDS